MTVKITKDRLPELARAVKLLTARQVMVGVPDETAGRPQVEGKRERINNAALAYIHETGIPEKNIPPRPFLGPGIEGAKGRILPRLKKAGEAALETGNVSAIDRALKAVGIIAQSAVQQKIINGPFVPLKPRTLAERRKRGNESDKPLVDTGQLFGAIKYVIRDRGK